VHFSAGGRTYPGDLIYTEGQPSLVVSWRTVDGKRAPYIRFPLNPASLTCVDEHAQLYHYEGPVFAQVSRSPPASAPAVDAETTGRRDAATADSTPRGSEGSGKFAKFVSAMPIHDLELAHTLHGALADIFVSNPQGGENKGAMDRVTRLCEAIVGSVNDLECRVTVRGIESLARLYFSDDGALGLTIGSMAGIEALRYQIFNALSALRGRLDYLNRRPPSKPELPAIQPAKGLKVLVVEDNQDSAESLRRLLEVCGYTVDVAYTGEEGVAAALRLQPDVVLCDIGLPDRDGFQVAAALKEVAETKKARLIAVTAYGSEQDRQRSRDAGFHLHLVKPVRPETLLKQLDDPVQAAQRR
jgi:CheY-like chemotaxis protein